MTSGVPEEFQTLYEFYYNYRSVHSVLSSIVCVIGLMLNVTYIYVLTRPKMRSSVNCLLTAVALCDSLLMLSYFLYVNYDRSTRSHIGSGGGIVSSTPATATCAVNHRQTFIFAAFTMLHVYVSIMSRSVSMWLSASVGISRYFIMKTRHGSANCNGAACKSITAAFCCVFISNIPLFLSFNIRSHSLNVSHHHHSSAAATNNGCLVTIYKFYPTDAPQLQFLVHATFWINGIVNKLLPTLTISVCVVLILNFLHSDVARRNSLVRRRESMIRPPTKTLLAIIMGYMLCELPHAVISVLSAVDQQIYHHIYMNIGDLLDLISLLNCMITFILHCSTSRNFQMTLLESLPCIPQTTLERMYFRRDSSGMGAMEVVRLYQRRFAISINNFIQNDASNKLNHVNAANSPNNSIYRQHHHRLSQFVADVNHLTFLQDKNEKHSSSAIHCSSTDLIIYDPFLSNGIAERMIGSRENCGNLTKSKSFDDIFL